MTIGLGDWYHQFHGRKSDHLTKLPCSSLQCHGETRWHGITRTTGNTGNTGNTGTGMTFAVYTCKQCGLVKSVNTVKREDGNK